MLVYSSLECSHSLLQGAVFGSDKEILPLTIVLDLPVAKALSLVLTAMCTLSISGPLNSMQTSADSPSETSRWLSRMYTRGSAWLR